MTGLHVNTSVFIEFVSQTRHKTIAVSNLAEVVMMLKSGKKEQ